MIDLLKIKTNFILPLDYEQTYEHYILSIESLIYKIVLPYFIKEPLKRKKNSINISKEKLEEHFSHLYQSLPVIYCTPFEKNHKSISVALLCSAKHTHGVGRFMCDLFSRWLIPGKQIQIVNTRSLAFQFVNYPKESFFLNEIILNISDVHDISLIKHNLPLISKELKMNILAVQHARHVISIKPLSLEQKKLLIQENIVSLQERSEKGVDHNIFEYVHQLVNKFLLEDKVTQINDQITPLLDLKPIAFDRDIFTDMQQFVLQLKDSFTLSRDIKHINKIISYHYIFRKIVSNSASIEPEQRHVSTKVLRTFLKTESSSYPILGILVCLNFINDTEVFEEKHLLKTVQSILPNLQMVPNSSIIERRGNKKIRSVYLEVEKLDKTAFIPAEIKEFKKKIPLEVKNRVETLVHPVFVHRNEEEIMRNILDLSRQLKYIHDLPQVIVNFHKQTAFEVSFIIILLRLKKTQERPFKELLHRSSTILNFYNHDVKIVGLLRKKYPKEAHVIEVRLHKKQFLRKDFSLDLYKARLCVVSEITRLIGDVRDYNGGMIAKQYEVLSALKESLLQEGVHNDFLLENFFYSLTPNYMQSILSPLLLKKAFLTLLKVLEHEFHKNLYFLNYAFHDDYYILMLGAVKSTFRETLDEFIDNFDSTNLDISYSWVNLYDITCVGFLLKYDAASEYESFYEKIVFMMRRWEETIKAQQEEISSLSFINDLVDYT
jgi:hypothetical protein